MLEKNNPPGRAQTSVSDILQKYAVIIVWIVLCIGFAAVLPKSFPTWLNIRSVLGAQSVLVVTALAVLVPIVAGDYDMSVAATLTLVNILVSKLNVSMGMDIVPAILIGLLIGILVGVINGFIVTKFNINPFIVTMGTQTLIAGLALMISQQSVTGIAQSLKNYVYVNRIAGISLSFFYALALVIIITYILTKTSVGKRVLIIGRSPQVASLSGINVSRIRFGCFVVSGFISALAGIMYTGVLGGGSPTSGLGYMLPAFAAVFLGSTCLKPGRFNAPGTIIAVYFLSTGTNGLSLLGAQSFITNVFYGSALIIAVVFSVVAKRTREKKEMKEAQHKRDEEEKILMKKLATMS